MLRKWIFLFFLIISISLPTHAKEIWGSSGFSLLYGTSYEVPFTTETKDESRYVITLDRLSISDWGNVFTFLDITQSTDANKNSAVYGEFTPRVSLFYLSKKEKPQGLFSDFLIAGSLEYGASPSGTNQLNKLLGAGLNFNIKGIKFLTLNFFRRNNQRYANNWQFTPVWGIPFRLGKASFVFDGWADYATKVKSKPYSLHSQIQLLYDLGEKLWHKSSTLYVGTEYKYWKNKFAINGINENVWQGIIMLRY